MNSFGKERDGLLAAHPTPKPVAMIADALRDVSKRGEYVVDPFLGSGSTLMAAEATGRICVGNELDGAYVDVAIRRWQKTTGQAAIHVQSGQSFEATAQAIAETPLIEALASNHTMTRPMATGVASVKTGEPETAALTINGSIAHVADTLAGSSSDLMPPDQPVASSMPLIDAAPDGDLNLFKEAGDDTRCAMTDQKKTEGVGYRRSPRNSQFKPGQSGNPKGRPKGTVNLRSDLCEELGEHIRVREGERELKVSKQRAMLKALVSKALKGDARAAPSC